MASLVRMRIELADAPGGLAQVAAAIGRYEGNITGIDVQQGDDDVAIDELTIEFGDDVDLFAVRREIASTAAARVISHQRASRSDPVAKMIRDLSAALIAPPEQRPEELRRQLAQLCGTPAAWLLTPVDASSFEVARLAADTPGTAYVGRSTVALPSLGETIPGESSLLAIAFESQVVLVARSITQRFTSTEADRVEALVEFHTRLAQREVSSMPVGGSGVA
ncbi:MAG: hypothetical protein NVS3B12_00940 [Acidimicrobiales bacterium]